MRWFGFVLLVGCADGGVGSDETDLAPTDATDVEPTDDTHPTDEPDSDTDGGSACGPTDECVPSAGVDNGCAPTCVWTPVQPGTFSPASVVVGQPDFASNTSSSADMETIETGYRFLSAVMAYDGVLWVTDGYSRGVAVYDPIPTANGQAASAALGYDDFSSGYAEYGPDGFGIFPQGLDTDGTRFFVADTVAHRVKIYNHIPRSNTDADLVIFQPDLDTTVEAPVSRTRTHHPAGLSYGGGKLVVPDTQNNRVLLFHAVPTTNDAAPDLVLGQADFDSGDANRGGTATAASMTLPEDVWTDGERLVVADTGNHRVLIWTTFPTSNGQAADLVLGQPDFETTSSGASETSLNKPVAVYSYANQLFVVEESNNRVLAWDTFPTTTQTAADWVLGQSSFTRNAANDDDQDGAGDSAPTARTLFKPVDVWVSDGKIYVADSFNHRVLIFE